VYPGIAQWLYENRCTYAKLAELIGAPQASVSRWMNGVHKPNKPTIDKILKVTGMTYEQAFGEEESSQPEEAAGLG
jgi:transcriptional regulator with XRE-family HTH domain